MDKKLQVLKDGLGNGLKVFKKGVSTDYIWNIDDFLNVRSIDDFQSSDTKYILFHFDLEKPITIGGETFTPKAKITKMYFDVKKVAYDNATWVCIMENIQSKNVDALPLWIIEKLSEWHINWRGLDEDQFIDASTGKYY